MLRKTGVFFTLVLMLLVISLLVACGSPAATTKATTSSASTTSTAAPTTTASSGPVKPQGDLVATLNSFGNEGWLPWTDAMNAPLQLLVYDMLIYWDHVKFKFLPGLAENWDVSQDGLTTTFHLRKGVQFTDGWGELTSADVKFNFEMHASSKSTGKTAQTRRITSMDTPDPYTLVVHFKDPYQTFFVDMSIGNSGVAQGFVSKKYYETVGEEAASQKPIGTGPYKLVDFQLGSFYKFEALDTHWRVVPEFKTLTVRYMAEVSSTVASLKTKEIDVAINLPAEQLADLKVAGIAVESSSLGGYGMVVSMGGMVIPEDKRYDAAIDNKDPWVDPRVRKAMALAIDRQAICKSIYAGYAQPLGVPLLTAGSEKYQYAYDPAAAKQLLKDAGYPNGFSFKAVSYSTSGSPEMPRLLEAICGYWQQIGLDPKLTAIDFNTYNGKNLQMGKTAGNVSLIVMSVVAEQLSKVELYLVPNVVSIYYQDEASYAIYRDNPRGTFEERNALVDKLNQYYYDTVGPIPVVMAGYCYAWNPDKVSPWPHPVSSKPGYFEYIRHAQPLNTYSLFRPWPDR